MDELLEESPQQGIADETEVSGFVAKIEAWAENFSGLLDRRTTGSMVALSLLYLAATIPLARLKFLGMQELFTYTIVGLPSAGRIWSVLATKIGLVKVGPMPPTFYFVTRFTQNLLGPSHLAIRLPELAGFWMASLGLFHYVRSRTSSLYGLVGVMALWITGAYQYAYEARPYGMVLGFCGLALVCWQMAADNVEGKPVRRWGALLGLFAALAGAVFSHYGGVLLLFPLGLGELVRSIRRRRVEWPVWFAFCGALVPLVLFYRLLGGSIRSYGLGMWSHPTLKAVIFCYTEYLSATATALAAVLAALGLWRVMTVGREESRRVRRVEGIPIHEIAAAVGLLLIPFVSLLQALLVTHQMAPRYAIPLVMGFGILFAFAAWKSLGGDAANGMVLVLVLLAGWGAHEWSAAGAAKATARATREFDALAARNDTGLPIAISKGYLFFQLAHYTSSRTATRLRYLADAELAFQYTGSDTLDLDMLAYRELASVKVIEAQPFWRTRAPFLLYVTPGDRQFDWILSALKDRAAKIQLVDMTDEGTLYRVVPN